MNQTGGEWEFVDIAVENDDGTADVSWIRITFVNREGKKIRLDFNRDAEIIDAYGKHDAAWIDEDDGETQISKRLHKKLGITDLITQYEPIARIML